MINFEQDNLINILQKIWSPTYVCRRFLMQRLHVTLMRRYKALLCYPLYFHSNILPQSLCVNVRSCIVTYTLSIFTTFLPLHKCYGVEVATKESCIFSKKIKNIFLKLFNKISVLTQLPERNAVIH